MYRVRTIEKQAMSSIICAIIILVSSGGLYLFAQSLKESAQYYWSSGYRNNVSAFSEFATIGMIAGVIILVIGICILSLKNTGKVCPQCEFVYSGSTMRCSKCGVDLTHAKKVEEYLAENPVAPISTSSADNASVSAIDHEKENSGKRFCGYCGKEINSEIVFCPYCGKKRQI